jgi:hypothetical protein
MATKYLARVYQLPSSGAICVVADVFEVPSMHKKTLKWFAKRGLWVDLCHTVRQDTGELLIVLFERQEIECIVGINCTTEHVQIYFSGRQPGDITNKDINSAPFVQLDILYIPTLNAILAFNLVSRAFESSLEVRGDYNVCPLLTPGSLVIRSMSPSKLSVIAEGDICSSSDFTEYAVVFEDLQDHEETSLMNGVPVIHETMIPLSDSQLLLLGGRAKLWNTWVNVSSVVVVDLDPVKLDVIGDFHNIPGIVVSWVRDDDCIYALWNSMKITKTDFKHHTMQVVFDQHFFNCVKPLLYWVKMCKARLSRSHIKFVMSLLQPPETEAAYANIVRARDLI